MRSIHVAVLCLLAANFAFGFHSHERFHGSHERFHGSSERFHHGFHHGFHGSPEMLHDRDDLVHDRDRLVRDRDDLVHDRNKLFHGNDALMVKSFGLTEKKTVTAKKVVVDNDMDASPTEHNVNVTEIENLFERLWKSVFGVNPVGSSEQSEEVGNVLGVFQPWWFGPNVCKREELSRDDDDDSMSSASRPSTDLMLMGQSMGFRCEDLGDASKCTVSATKNGTTHRKARIFECCLGFARVPGRIGCPKALELKDVQGTLDQMNLTHFVDSMHEVGLDQLLNANRTLTYFVPDNSALVSTAQLEDISVSSADKQDKKEFARQVLKGHIVTGRNYSYLWSDEKMLRTLNNDSIIRINFFSYPRSFMTANCARITRTDIQASNGLIHTVDRVLMPAKQTLWEMISMDKQFSILASLIDADLQKKLSDPMAHWTLLAFTDDAFNKLPMATQTAIKNKLDCFKDICMEFVLPNTICSAAIFGDAAVQNIAGNYLNATRMDSTDAKGEAIYFDGVKVKAADRVATNGVMHVLEAVPMMSAVMKPIDALKKRNDTEFVDLLTANNIRLDSLPEATIFVPPMNSFKNITGAKLVDGLKNHIVGDLLKISADMNATKMVTTMAGQMLKLKTEQVFDPFSLDMRPMKLVSHIGCARIIAANIPACGGVIHYIDKPLLVPDSDLVGTLKSYRQLSMFVSLLQSTGLLDELSKPGFNGTVLAPINRGFNQSMSAEQWHNLMADKNAMRKFLMRHIITDSLCQYELCNDDSLSMGGYQTMSGEPVMGHGSGSNFRIDGVTVLKGDIVAKNGIIQIISLPLVNRPITSILDILRIPFDDDM